MLCPYCGGELAFGYIQNRDGVYWMQSKRAISALVPPERKRKDIVSLNAGRVGYLSGGSAEAWLCRSCKKVIIDYAPKQSPEDEE